MRLPLATTIQSRDGTLDKDSKLVNAFVESAGESSSVFRRPGTLTAFELGANQGRGVFCWKNTFFAAVGNTLVQGPTSALIPDGSLWTLTDSIDSGVGRAAFLSGLGRFSAYDSSTDTMYGVIKSPPQGVERYFKVSQSSVASGAVTFNGDVAAAEYQKFGCAFFKGKVWLVGGSAFGSSTVSYIYSSVNGESFTQQSNGPFSARERAPLVVSTDGNSMYFVCGNTSLLSPTATKEVWETPDGTNWTEVAMPVGFAARMDAVAFCRDDYLYIAAGYNGSTYLDDVWRGSKTGSVWTWEQVQTGLTVSVSAYMAAGGVGDSNIFSIQDSSGSGVVYQTSNGSEFSLATSSAPFDLPVATKSVGDDFYILALNESGTNAEFKWWKATNNVPGGDVYAITGDTLPISFTQTSGAASTEYLVLKTTAAAWVLTFGTPGTLNQIVDVDFPGTTVPGVVYLDGYFFVMTPAAEIYNSDLENPTSWDALNFISAEVEPDNPIALAKHQNYVVALKDTTTELFYNAANTTGSPLARTQNAALQIGCGAGYSVANVDGGLFFISKTRSTGLSVHYFAPDALVPTEVATPGVQRILSAADLTTVHCFAGRIGGHTFYVVNLVSDGITLAFDLQSRTWAQWTYLTAQASQNVTSITQADGVATVTLTGHGFADGDPVVIAGADQAGYNGTHNIRYVDANTFRFDVAAATVSPATGTITATGYDEGYFPFGFFGSCGGFDYIQHETSGEIFKIATAYNDDNGVPINFLVRTPQLDLDNRMNKVMGSLELIADQSSDTVLVRYTDDDYQTYSKFRSIPLDSERTQIRRMGKFRKRALEFRCTTDGDLRVFAADVAV